MHVLFELSTDSKNFRVEGGCTFMRKIFEIPPNNGKYSLFLSYPLATSIKIIAKPKCGKFNIL
jgi:hypothetical protein